MTGRCRRFLIRSGTIAFAQGESDCGRKVLEDLNGDKNTEGAHVRDNSDGLGRRFGLTGYMTRWSRDYLGDMLGRSFSIPG